MAASSLLCNFSSACFPNDYVPEPSELCLTYEALKCELKNTKDELKSARLIIELLVNEVNTLKACSEASGSNLKTDDTNPADFHKWIPVKRAHSFSHKPNLTIQPKNLITLTNSFEVLGNLDEASEKATSNLPKAPKPRVFRCKNRASLRNTLLSYWATAMQVALLRDFPSILVLRSTPLVV
jgi:hypothetical protein